MRLSPIYSLFLVLCSLAASIAAGPALAQQLAVKGETVYTMAGEPITDGIVLISDGKIQQIGSAAAISIPEGYELFEAPVVTPGMIDTRTVVGLAGIFNMPHDQDQLETSNPFQPDLRAVDAYNAREDLVVWLRNLGVTTLHTGHGPGALASGQTMIVKSFGNTVEAALVDSVSMVAFTLGPSVGSNYNGNPGTRSRAMAMLRAEFIKAQEYKDRENASRDLKMETLASILDGDIRAMISAHKVSEILAALRLQREFGFELVIEGASEAYLLLDELKQAGVHIIIHPTMARTRGETANAAFTTAAALAEHDIPFTFQSGYEGYVPKTRVIHYEAGIAVANGLPFYRALQALTIDAARFLQIDERTGSLEPGKDADLVLWEGDPFEYLNRVCTVIINGKVASNGCR